MLFVTIFVFIFILSLIMICHEYGHYLGAKITHVPVRQFGIGFFKPILKWKRKETQFSINILPLGAFVDVLGLDNPKEKKKEAYWNQSVNKRFIIASFGVLFNLLLAWIFLTFSLWLFALLPSKHFVIIQEVKPQSAAETAGLKAGDIIVAGNGQNFPTAEEVTQFTKAHRNEIVTLKIKHNGKEVEKKIQLGSDTEAPLGIAMTDSGFEEKIPFYQAPITALKTLGQATYTTFAYLGRLIISPFIKEKVPLAVSGPVGIYGIIAQFTEVGLVYLLRIAAFFSLGIGIFNLIPLPALDGARMIFLMLEKIFGRKVIKPEVENTLHSVGFVFLIALMLLVTYNDIVGLIRK